MEIKIVNNYDTIRKHLILTEKEAFEQGQLAFLHEIFYVELEEQGWEIVISSS